MTELGGNVRELSSSYLKKRLRRFDANLCPKKLIRIVWEMNGKKSKR